jgi:hypothetical protein
MGGVTYHRLERGENNDVVGVHFETLYSPMNVVELTAHHGVNCWFVEEEELYGHRKEFEIDLPVGKSLRVLIDDVLQCVFTPNDDSVLGFTTHKVVVESAKAWPGPESEQ